MNKYMHLAILEANKAFDKNEIPVGSVVVCDNKVVAKGYNDRQNKCSVLGHAEINAILKAEKKIKDWRLDNCDMYVTLYPCEMCRIVIKESRIRNVYYLLDDNKKNNIENNYIQIIESNDEIEKYKNKFKKFFNNLRNCD